MKSLVSNPNLHTSFHSQGHSCETTLLWVPSHKGIPGNIKIDNAAKLASKNPRIYPPALLSSTDITFFYTSSQHSLQLDQVPSENELDLLPAPWPSATIQNVGSRSSSLGFTPHRIHLPYSFPLSLRALPIRLLSLSFRPPYYCTPLVFFSPSCTPLP